MKAFDYYEAENIDQAIGFLQEFNGEGSLLAGGTDLIVSARGKKTYPKGVIDISKIEELCSITLENNKIRIGAATKLYKIVKSDIVNKYAGILAVAAGKVGSVQIRNMATIGGNVGNAAPSADLITPLMVLESKAVVVGPEGERILLVSEMFKGPGSTVLSSTELIKEFIVPCASANTGLVYLKNGRRPEMDIAAVGCAVRLEVDSKNKRITNACVALGAVAPTAVLVKGVNEKLNEKILNTKLCEEIADFCSEQVSPITDVRSTSEHRLHMVKVLVKNGLKGAYTDACG